jgi:hypothetical protein
LDRQSSFHLSIPLSGGLSLRIQDKDNEQNPYPSSRIQKGLVLWHGNEDLSEEGVGFGVPVFKRGHRTIYPGSVKLDSRTEGGLTWVKASYDMNILEKAYINEEPVGRTPFYRIHETLSRWHRKHPFLRAFLRHSGALVRRAFHIRIRFEEGASAGLASVEFKIDAEKRTILIALDAGSVSSWSKNEIFMMNELGANFFDLYNDSDGSELKKESIGTWGEVSAREATFSDSSRGISFTLWNADGAKMFRGRELVPGKLAWAGLSYQLPRYVTSFSYLIKIESGVFL